MIFIINIVTWRIKQTQKYLGDPRPRVLPSNHYVHVQRCFVRPFYFSLQKYLIRCVHVTQRPVAKPCQSNQRKENPFLSLVELEHVNDEEGNEPENSKPNLNQKVHSPIWNSFVYFSCCARSQKTKKAVGDSDVTSEILKSAFFQVHGKPK